VKRVGISPCFFHADPLRPLFKGKTLLYLEESMARYVAGAGALPYLIPTGAAAEVYARDLDGLLLHGGADVCPASYGEEAMRPEWNGDRVRDDVEAALFHAFVASDKPVLGICRGAQLINVAMGGTLYQDINTQVRGSQVHRNWDVYDALEHEVHLLGWLAALFQRDRGLVNSVHHQAVKDLAPGLAAEALSADGVVEAVRDPARRFVVGVQWHPEWQVSDQQLSGQPLVRAFLAA
jgi:putative glutamine amidotransferase